MKVGISDIELQERAHTAGELSPAAKPLIDILLNECLTARKQWRRIEKENLRLSQFEMFK